MTAPKPLRPLPPTPDPDGWTPEERQATLARLALIRRVHLHDGTPTEFIAAFAGLLRLGYDPLYGRRLRLS